MVVPFGISIGDFIAVGDLAYRVVWSLQESRGSCVDYRCLISSLSSLQRCLQTTSGIFLGHSFNHDMGLNRLDDAVVNGIIHETACVRKLLEDFLIASQKYTESLLPKQLKKNVKGEWRKIKWALSSTGDILRLQRDLQSHIQAFQLYAFTLCCQSTKNSLDDVVTVNERTQMKILEMFDIVKRISDNLPIEIGYAWEGGWTDANKPIRFQDALGRNLILPYMFCSNQKTFHDILQIMFRKLPGQVLVEQKEYDLQDATGLSLQGADWPSKITPGVLLTMSMLMKLPPSWKRAHVCPRCSEANNQLANTHGLILCLFCQLLFRILTKEKLIELPERPIRPRTKRKIAPPSSQSLQTAVGSNSSFKGLPRKKTTAFREEGVFKRISYVHQTLISQAPKSSSDQDKLVEMQPLHEAAIAGDLATVQAILKAGSSINSQDEYYGSVLQAACSSVDHNGTDLVLYLLTQEHLDVNSQGGNYCTALQAASVFGNETVVKLLLEHGADPNIKGGEYGTALHAAARNASTSIVRLLLENGAKVGTTHPHWGDALQTAAATAYHNSSEVLQVLIDYGADANAEGGFYGTALEAAAAYYGHTDSEDSTLLLLKNGADVNALGGEYGSSLHVAAYKGKPALAQLLLDHGADIDVQDDHWGTPLQAAVSTIYSGGEQVAQMLVERGADINALSGEYGSALHAAAFKGKEELVDYLLEKGANPDLELEDGSTALHVAARNGHFGVVKLLTEE